MKLCKQMKTVRKAFILTATCTSFTYYFSTINFGVGGHYGCPASDPEFLLGSHIMWRIQTFVQFNLFLSMPRYFFVVGGGLYSQTGWEPLPDFLPPESATETVFGVYLGSFLWLVW